MTMKTLIGNENKRTILFGKRHRVAVTFTRVGGLWHAHGAMLPTPQRNIRDARAIVARRLTGMNFVAKGGEIVIGLEPGTAVTWGGSRWTVKEWQPDNGIDGAYWLKNAKGESAVAGADEVKVLRK
jgi:hypothetical protein